MSASSALLALMYAKVQKRYFAQQQMIAESKYNANLEELNQYERYEAKWEEAFEDCSTGAKKCKFGGKVYVEEGGTCSKAKAIEYANKKTKHDFTLGSKDEMILDGLTEKDMTFDALQTTFGAMCEKLDADISNLEELAKTECANTNTLSGGS